MKSVLLHYLLWKLGLAKPWTWYSAKECDLLSKYASQKETLVEIGCWHGVNTLRIRNAMSPKGTLYAVDPYPLGRFRVSFPKKIAHANVAKSHNGNVVWLEMSDLEGAEYFHKRELGSADFIFSDSLNTYEGLKNTWESWRKLLKPGGIFVIANSHSTAEKPLSAGSVKFTKEVILSDPEFKLREQLGCFTVLEKCS